MKNVQQEQELDGHQQQVEEQQHLQEKLEEQQHLQEKLEEQEQDRCDVSANDAAKVTDHTTNSPKNVSRKIDSNFGNLESLLVNPGRDGGEYIGFISIMNAQVRMYDEVTEEIIGASVKEEAGERKIAESDDDVAMDQWHRTTMCLLKMNEEVKKEEEEEEEEDDDERKKSGSVQITSKSGDCSCCVPVVRAFYANARNDRSECQICIECKSFNGLMEDVFCSRKCIHTSGDVLRSDASLILGCCGVVNRDGGYIEDGVGESLLEFDVILRINRSQSAQKDMFHDKMCIMDIVVLAWYSDSQQLGSSSDHLGFVATNSCHNSFVLLMELLSSEWNELKENILANEKELVDGLVQTKCSSNLPKFPCSMNLSEVYIRIGKPNPLMSTKERGNDSLEQCGKIDLRRIPQHLYSPFLDAQSLAAMRCTNKFFSHALQSIIPGLKLSLVKHQISSLAWMRSRESKKSRKKKFISRMFNGIASKMTLCFDGESLRYKITEKVDATLNVLPSGGLLCDDPGLGKTITVLALILQSIHNNDVSKSSKASNSEELKEEIFLHCWERLTLFTKRQEMYKILNAVRRLDPQGHFQIPVDPIRDGCTDYFSIIKEPISLSEIVRRVSNFEYGRLNNFSEFVHSVNLCFQNALQYNPPDSFLHENAAHCLRSFGRLESGLKEKYISRVTSRGTLSKNDLELNRLVSQWRDCEITQHLHYSDGTLIVVPATLLDHWKEQLNKHVDLNYCVGDLDKKSGVSMHNKTTEEIQRYQRGLTVFVDEDSKKALPSAEFLSKFKIVIVPSKRLSNEWKKGSLESEVESIQTLANFSEASQLCKVMWHRLVVDEGHGMGSGASNIVKMASWVRARNRWVMTGTPTPQMLNNKPSTTLRKILGLVDFVGCLPEFRLANGGNDTWKHWLIRYWNEGNVTAFFRLRNLLGAIMVRHTKEDLVELPPPKYLTSKIKLSDQEVLAYNTLSTGVLMNILITGMKGGKTSGWADSLLNPRNLNDARQAIQNIRMACCGGRSIAPTLDQQFYDETLEILKVRHKVDDVGLKIVSNFLKRATSEQTSGCHKCGRQFQVLLVVPCAHLVCVECLKGHQPQTNCPVCHNSFDIDEFQLLQPGFVLQFKWNIEDDKKAWNTRMVKEINLEQGTRPFFNVMAHSDTGSNNDSSESNNINLRRKKKHTCRFSPKLTTGVCLICHTMHFDSAFDCDFVNPLKRCVTCHRVAEECPPEESKANYIVNKLSSLLRTMNLSEKSLPLKVIIFSQFRSLLNLIGDRLLRKFGQRCISEYWGQSRSDELHKFVHSRRCFAMLLGKDGSLGLDLSFTTNIFFLDEIWDKSLESQVVSRAYRMGARTRERGGKGVVVEKLVAANSIEELIHETVNSEYSELGSHNDLTKNKESKQARLHFLLKSLKPIHYKNAKVPSLCSIAKSTKSTNECLKRSSFAADLQDDRPQRLKVRFA